VISTELLERLCISATEDGVERLIVGAIVVQGDTVLLLRRPAADFLGGLFELPSGNVEPGESLDAALVREVEEEAFLDVTDVVDYIGCFDYASGSGKKCRQFNFDVTVARFEPVVLQEHDDYLWAALDDELPVTDAVREILRRYRGLRAV